MDGRKKKQRGGDQKWVDFHERGGDGRYRGSGGEARGSLLGEEAGELQTLCVFVWYNIHVTGPLLIFEKLFAAFK